MSFKLKGTLIIHYTYFSGRRLVISTGEHIEPSLWNATKQRPKSNPTLKTLLDRFESRVSETHLQLRSQFETVTPESLRAAINREIKTGGKRENLMEWVKRHLSESKLNKGTLATHDNAYKLLKSYSGCKDFSDITPTWFETFQHSLETDGYSANYIAITISIIKSWMKQSGDQGLHRNESYKLFTVGTVDTDAIYLTSDELSAIKRVELSPSQSRIRDRFLISAYTGLRFSDNISLTADSIQNGFIRNRNKKTDAVIVVPIHAVVAEILSRYPSGLPKSVTNARTNIVLKKIGELAKINTMVEISRTIGGKVVTTSVPKYELICTHSGRRSFATNAVKAGIPTSAVRTITGHSTESSFNRYLRISQEENAEALQSHSFFNQ